MIEIYGKKPCPHCDRVIQLCKKEGLEYTYKQLGKDFNREEMLLMFPNAKTFPQIKIEGKVIGEYTDLVNWYGDPRYK